MRALTWGARAWLAVGIAAVVVGCGGGGTSSLDVDVTYPNDAARNMTDSLHVWVLDPRDDEAVTCSALIGGKADPYAIGVERLADAVFLQPDAPRPRLDNVPKGSGVLVYVEAVDRTGEILYAGCVTTNVGGTVAVSLERARVFDCADPATEEGSPCDDGLNCTVNTVCRSGACIGGAPRNCNHKADACNAGDCTESEGCVARPLTNGTPCNDGSACTKLDQCQGGTCGGTPVVCPTTTQCIESYTCNPNAQSWEDPCVAQRKNYGEACEDGNFCTTGDYCDWYGACASGSGRANEGTQCEPQGDTCKVCLGTSCTRPPVDAGVGDGGSC